MRSYSHLRVREHAPTRTCLCVSLLVAYGAFVFLFMPGSSLVCYVKLPGHSPLRRTWRRELCFVRRKEVVNEGSNLKIQLRNYSDNPDKISVRLEGVVAAPLICILSVLNEVDHFSNWVPYFTKPFK